MSVFQANSRYLKFAALTSATDRRGRTVACLTPARIPAQLELGKHRLKDGQRLDHLAQHYLNESTAYWRIAALNDAMTPDQIAAAPFIAIPVKGS
ncbi:hypothetical protein [Sphingosinicella terrae]|uniref:hypothetical protein n=1 Tax=Sphingosinicella terrae TaxID=2172047 RepID=UPI000E0D78F2|nr:hypothetical protein [Sphingosinicella terrae]